MLHVSVIGLGAWGSALGITAHRAGSFVTMVGLESDVQRVKEKGHIASFPDICFPSSMQVEHTHDSLSHADIVICAVPAQLLRNCLKNLKGLSGQVPLVIASKGIEQSTGCLMGEVAQEILPNPIAILSGPNFASEIVKNQAAATTIGCEDPVLGQKIISSLAHKNFRPYLNKDVVGVQIGGAVKNVLAIACGIVRARGMGENAVASLITRGLHEIKRFGVAKGGREATFSGLSGVGDVVLTCMGTQSRNFRFGFDLAQKNHVETEVLASTTVEGFYTAQALQKVSRSLNIEMPLCTMVYKILYEFVGIDEAIQGLLERPLKEE